MVSEVVADPQTESFALIARSFAGGFMAFEIGEEEFGYADAVELAAYHLISLECEVDGKSKDILKDVINKRNELRDRESIIPSNTGDRFVRKDVANIE